MIGDRNRGSMAACEPLPFDVVAVDAALQELEWHDAEATQFLKLCFFTGLTHQDAAAALGIGRQCSLPSVVIANPTNTDLTDAGLVHLKRFTSLRRLNLEHTKVTDIGLVHGIPTST